jgi:pimeloyl-ACP methyl ester carboxylesterase
VSGPVWLTGAGDPVFAFVHEPGDAEKRDVAVVICPPFGWEEMCSHRARRTWAMALADAGFPCVRIDLPSGGESGGMPRDPDRVGAWKTAIAGAAGWARQEFAVSRVAVIGIGAGGLAATAAVADHAPVDDLILWGVPARGRTLLRELRAYAAVVAARYPGDEHDAPEQEGLEVTGFTLSEQTLRDLERIDLTKLELPDAERRRVLLVARDELGVDRRLREYLTQAGVSLEVLDATDFGLLMAHPQEGRAPHATIAATIRWLGSSPAESGSGAANEAPAPGAAGESVRAGDSRVRAAEAVRIVHEGREITEMPLTMTTPSGRSFAMLSAPVTGPSAPVCGVLLDAGALRRIGPNRTWVELSRRWAGRGVPTVRVDFAGIGDSDGDEGAIATNTGLYSQAMTDQTLALLDELAARGLPPRFVLVGLCSGAYWALHAALADRRVAGAFMLNLYSFYWSEALVAERDRRETVTALRSGVLRRLARGEISAYHVRRALHGIRGGFRAHTRSIEGSQESEVGLALDTLRDQGTEVLLALSEGEPLYDQFEREGRLARMHQWPNVTLERVPSRDHMVRALWIQAAMHQRLDDALDRLLGRVWPERGAGSDTGAISRSVLQ